MTRAPTGARVDDPRSRCLRCPGWTVVALATAFVRLRSEPDKASAVKAGKDLGDAAGKPAGKAFGEGFYQDANGRMRQANGRFATDAQKAMLGSGTAAGKGFGENFHKSGGGVIKSGFSKLKGALGPLLVPLGIGAAVAAIGKIGITYEDNLNIFQSVTKATGGEMDQVAKKARALGADVTLPGVSAAGAAAAMTELSKASFTVQESMDAATGTLQLARAAGIDEAQAATLTANAVRAFGINAKDAVFVSDELAAAANSSSVEITDVGDAFKMAASVFSSFQGPTVGSKEAITELNTAIAVLGNNGIKGSDAGTSLKQMLLQLTGPTQQAKDQMALLAASARNANIPMELQDAILKGSKKVRADALAQLYKLNPALKDEGDIAFDSAGKMRPLKDIIALTAAGTKNMTQEERAYALTQIFGADASRAVITLMKGGLPVYEDQRTAVLRQGAAADVAAAKNKGLGGAIDNVKSQMENAAISIYSAVKGPLTAGLNGLANILSPLAGQISSFAGFVSRNIGVIRDWAVAIGVVTLALKINSAMLAVQAAGGLVGWIKLIRPVSAATRLWAGAQALLNVTLIANPIGIVIVALAALGAGLVLAYRHSETFRKIVDAVWSGIRAVIGAVASWFTGKIVPSIRIAIDQGATAFRVLQSVNQAVWSAVRLYVTTWWNVVRAIFLAVRAWLVIVGTAFRAFATIGGIAMRTLGAGIRAVWDSIRTGSFAPLRTFITQTLPNAFRAGVNAITAAWNRVKEAARVPVAFVVNRVINPLIGGWKSIAKIFDVGAPDPIRGFEKGGRIPGRASATDNLLATMTDARGMALSPLKVATGEYVVNADATQRWLPVLERINNSGGGRNLPGGTLPGFAGGGLIGWARSLAGKAASATSNIFKAISDPSGTVKRIADAAINAIPGGGFLRTALVGGGRRLLSAVIKKIQGLVSLTGGGGAAGIGGNASPGFPPWPSSPSAQRGDSGVWRNVVALIRSTGPVSGSFGNGYRSGDPLWHGSGRAVDWMGFNQDALATLLASRRPLELIHRTSQRDYAYTRGRNKGSFNNSLMEAHRNHIHIAMAEGGLLSRATGMPLRLFDSGGAWPTGTLGANLSGRTEYVSTDASTERSIEIHIHNSGVIGSQGDLDLWLEKGVKRLRKQRRLP
jgi:TP901 family phage tail tape measure protein